MDERLIEYYDLGEEEMVEVTQELFDTLLANASQMDKDICALQELLDAHGIAIPTGMKRRNLPSNPPAG